jgi:hypothetical protein
MKFYFAETKDEYYQAVILGDNEQDMIEALNEQLGLEEEWNLTELSELDINTENPIVLANF